MLQSVAGEWSWTGTREVRTTVPVMRGAVSDNLNMIMGSGDEETLKIYERSSPSDMMSENSSGHQTRNISMRPVATLSTTTGAKNVNKCGSSGVTTTLSR